MSEGNLTIADVAEAVAECLTARYEDAAEAVVGPLYESRVLVFRRDGMILTVDVNVTETRA